MNTILFYPSENKGEQSISIDCQDPRFIHIQSVLKLKAGDEFKLGILGEGIGLGKIETLTDLHCTICWQELTLQVPNKIPLHLILALPRPKIIPRILKRITEIGIQRLTLINASRVEKPYWSAHQLKAKRIESSLIEGLSLSNDIYLPTVELAPFFRPFVEDQLSQNDSSDKWVAHPSREFLFNSVKNNHVEVAPTILAIGPEGGWSAFELELFQSVGFKMGGLGPRVLSVESALGVSLGLFISKLQFRDDNF